MKNETIKKWLKRNGFRYTAGQWRQMIDGGEMGLLTCEATMNVLGGRGFGRRSADAVVNLYHRAEGSETRDFLKKMGVIGFYQGVEYLPVFDDAPAFPIHDFYIEGHLSKILRGKIDRFEKSAFWESSEGLPDKMIGITIKWADDDQNLADEYFELHPGHEDSDLDDAIKMFLENKGAEHSPENQAKLTMTYAGKEGEEIDLTPGMTKSENPKI